MGPQKKGCRDAAPGRGRPRAASSHQLLGKPGRFPRQASEGGQPGRPLGLGPPGCRAEDESCCVSPGERQVGEAAREPCTSNGVPYPMPAAPSLCGPLNKGPTGCPPRPPKAQAPWPASSPHTRCRRHPEKRWALACPAFPPKTEARACRWESRGSSGSRDLEIRKLVTGHAVCGAALAFLRNKVVCVPFPARPVLTGTSTDPQCAFRELPAPTPVPPAPAHPRAASQSQTLSRIPHLSWAAGAETALRAPGPSKVGILEETEQNQHSGRERV